MCANPYLQLRDYGFSLAKAGYFWVFSLLLFGKGRMGSLKPLQNPQPMERRLADVANR